MRASIITIVVKHHGNTAHKICSKKQSLNTKISQIKTFMPWNGYSKRVRNSVIKPLETNGSCSRLTDDDD